VEEGRAAWELVGAVELQALGEPLFACVSFTSCVKVALLGVPLEMEVEVWLPERVWEEGATGSGSDRASFRGSPRGVGKRRVDNTLSLRA
jgi:hypothetical protein